MVNLTTQINSFMLTTHIPEFVARFNQQTKNYEYRDVFFLAVYNIAFVSLEYTKS